MDNERIKQLIAEAKARDEGSRMNPEVGFRRLKSFGAGAVEGATLGSAGPTIDRMMKGYDTGSFWKDLLANAALGTLPMSEPIISRLMGVSDEQGPVEQWLNEAQEGSPGAAIAGNVAGGIGMGGPASGAGRTIMREAGEAAIPYVSKLAQSLVRSTGGRIAGSTAAGAGEGAVYALNKDQDVGTGAGLGALGGASGQTLLGELGPGLYSLFKNTQGPQKAATFAMEKAGQSIGHGPGSGRDFPIEETLARRAELGDEATLMDVNPGFRRLGEAMASSGDAQPHAQDILYRYGEGSPRSAQIAPEFEEEVGDAMIKAFQAKGINTAGARAPRTASVIRQDAIANRQKLQPEFEKALANGPVYKADEMRSLIGQHVDFSNKKTNIRAIDNQIQDTIDELTKEDRRIISQGLPEGAPLPPEGELRPQSLLTLREELDDIANQAMKSGDRQTAAHVLKARRAISEHMVDTIPGFGSINARYSNEFSYERAYDTARKAFSSNNVDDDSLRIAMEAASPADLPGFMEGASQAIVNKLTSGDAASMKTARDFLRNSKTQAKLEQMFGTEAKDLFVGAADKAATFANTAAKVSGGSRTQLRSAMAEELERYVRQGILGLGATRLFTNKTAGIAPSTAAGLGAASREAKDRARSAHNAVYPTIDSWLAAPGAQADENLMKMKQLADEWYPSTSLAGRGFMDPLTKHPYLNTLLQTNLGNVPAQGTAVGAASTQDD